MVGIMVRLLIIMFMELISAAHASDQRLLGPDDVVVGSVVKRCGSPTPPPAPTTWEELESSLNALMAKAGLNDPNGSSLLVSNLKMIEISHLLNPPLPTTPFPEYIQLQAIILKDQLEFIATTWPSYDQNGGWYVWYGLDGGNSDNYIPYPLVADFIKSRANLDHSSSWENFRSNVVALLPPPQPNFTQAGFQTLNLMIDTLRAIECSYVRYPDSKNLTRSQLALAYQRQLNFISSTWLKNSCPASGWDIWNLPTGNGNGPEFVSMYPPIHAFIKSRYDRLTPNVKSIKGFDLGETTEDNCCSRFFGW